MRNRSQNPKIVMRPVGALRSYPRNARKHSKKQMKQIAASIERFGFTNPVLVDGDGQILAGHGRVEAAKLLGMSEVPTIPFADFTPAEVRAYVLADNKLALNAGWDQELLAIELQGLIDLDFEVELTGFSLAETDLILDQSRNRDVRGVRDGRPYGSPQPPAAVSFYSPDRKGEHPRVHLKGFTGVLHADGYAGFNPVFETGQVTEAACWAHVRRKFFDEHAINPSAATTEALDRIGVLYGIEDTIRGLPPDVRRRSRQQQAIPLMAELRAWLEATLPRLSAKSDLAKAIRYTLGRWAALNRYADDGRIEIDNNAAERSIRAIALGRKNWLFAGSDTGGERAAAIYSLIETCKLNRIDPEAYLRSILACIADHPINRIADLLPWNWASSQPNAQAA
jgi:hypothetical protein